MADEWKRTAMLVIDMQKDFLLPGKSLQVAPGLDIIPNVIKAVEIARQRSILVVREHDPMGRDGELIRLHLYGKGKDAPFSKGSVGAELFDGLEIQNGDYKLVKTRFSAFFGTNLHSFLQRTGINSLVVTGFQTPKCIRQTVVEAVELDYPSIAVITDATVARTPVVHASNLLDMKNVGVATPTLKEWCESSA